MTVKTRWEKSSLWSLECWNIQKRIFQSINFELRTDGISESSYRLIQTQMWKQNVVFL